MIGNMCAKGITLSPYPEPVLIRPILAIEILCRSVISLIRKCLEPFPKTFPNFLTAPEFLPRPQVLSELKKV